jgi:hypothetical protein
LGGRNTLLYYRDLKQGTLDIGPGSGASPLVVDALLSSRPVRLSLLFGDAAIGGAARRARTVRAKAAENFEERGLRTLFLAWGMATWSNPRGTAVPAAPVLLRQAALTARGGAGETLLHLLKADYQVDADGAGLLELFGQESEPPDRGRCSSGSPRPQRPSRVSRWSRGQLWVISPMPSSPARTAAGRAPARGGLGRN